MFEALTPIFYDPILNLLVWLYNTVPGHDIGVAIVLVTFAIRVLTYPLVNKQLKSQAAMNALQPKLNEVREKYKNDKEGQAKAMMEMYKTHKVNPLSSCLPLLIQLPVLIALYYVFNYALKGDLTGLYPFVYNPGSINPTFFGLVNLAKPDFAFALVAGALQFWQTKMMMPKNAVQDATAKALNLQALYFFPIITVVFAWNLPAGLPLYWIVNTLFGIVQQWYIQRTPKPGTVEIVK